MTKFERFVCVVTPMLLALALMAPAWAQGNATFTIEQLQVDESSYPEMSAVASVLNPSGVPVTDLTQDDFTVLEDDQPLALTAVDAETNTDLSIAVALVLDLSGSAPLDDVKAAAYQFLDSLGPNDRVALIGFNTPVEIDTFDPSKEVDFTTDKDLIRGVIDGLSTIGETAVYEAIYKGVLVTSEEKAERRAVIVMTDGFDTASRAEIATSDTPKTAARDRRIPIFTVGVYSPQFSSNPDYLKVLANESGGRYQEAADPAELGNLFQNVIDQLQLQYRLSFHTDLPPDGKDHVLTFQVTTADGQMTVDQTVKYPGRPPVPQILKIQQDINGELEDLRPEIKGKVLLVPQISAQNPIVKVEYFLDDQLTHTVMVDAQESKGTHEPWEWKWDTCEASEGAHTLAIVAYDDDGAASAKKTTNVEINRAGSICIPGLGAVDTKVVIAVAAGVLLLLFVLAVLILASRRRELAPAFPGTRPFPGAPPPPPPAPSPTPQAPPAPGYTPTMPVQPPSYEPAGPGAVPARTEILHKEPEAMAWLVAQQGPLTGREFRLGEATSIGRTGDNDIVLDDPAVSRQHAKVKLEDKAFFLYDMGATNPTLVNGQQVARHLLTDGDRIEIGRTVLVFKRIQSTQT
jgi:VWFA-related protein